MSDLYEDIINLPHWEPQNRQRMPMVNRAAQFAPFAALVGHDEAIRETARVTEDFIELDAETASLLNEKINILADNVSCQPEIEVTYFVRDLKKDGGSYVKFKGNVRRLDEVEQTIIFTDGTQLHIPLIRDLQGPVF